MLLLGGEVSSAAITTQIGCFIEYVITPYSRKLCTVAEVTLCRELPRAVGRRGSELQDDWYVDLLAMSTMQVFLEARVGCEIVMRCVFYNVAVG